MAAQDPDAEVRRAAAATMAMLCAAYPEIAAAREQLCPAARPDFAEAPCP